MYSPVMMKSMVGSRSPGMRGKSTSGGAYPESYRWHNGTERYAEFRENEFLDPKSDPLSTFSLDVDTSSYAMMRRYLTDEKPIAAGGEERPYDGPVVVLDFESTGLNTGSARIIEIGAVKLCEGTITDRFEQLVDPGEPLPAKVAELTGITDAQLKGQPVAAEILPKLMDFIGDAAIAAHNASFDASLLRTELKRIGRSFDNPVLDTLTYARKLYPEMKSFKLHAVCKHLGVSLRNAHRAVHDATATAGCLKRMFEETAERLPQVRTLGELNTALRGGAIGESWHI